MSLWYFPDEDVVLVHVPKTGGTTARAGVFKGDMRRAEFREVPDSWPYDRSWMFVRDPVDRMCSVLAWADSWNDTGGRRLTVADAIRICDDRRVDPDDFDSWEGRVKHHALPQTHPYYHHELAALRLPFSKYWRGLQYVAKAYGFAHLMPKQELALNRTGGRPITSGEREMVERYYRDDRVLYESVERAWEGAL